MEKIIFTCKTVTPLVMNGAYGDFPELRPPGIKASLRFWWRAINGHLPLEDRKDLKGNVLERGLRTCESDIFGSTKGRSKMLIRVTEPIDESQKIKHSLLPHKSGSEASAFKAGLTFQIRLDCEKNQREMLKNLFILACTLGGWGKRSMRGFGSVTVTEIDGKDYSSPTDLNGILGCLNMVGSEIYVIVSQPTRIKLKSPISKLNRSDEYPWITEIQIGDSPKSISEIGQATHDVMSEFEPQKLNYKYALGAGSPRFALPIFVSILSDGRPIITTLKSVPPQITRKDKERGAISQFSLQTDLKNLLLNP